jgi:hypothetical protein
LVSIYALLGTALELIRINYSFASLQRFPNSFPRLAPWAAFLRRFAAVAGVLWTCLLLLYSALVSAWDPQILPVLRYRAASDLNALRLQDAGDLLVGERAAGSSSSISFLTRRLRMSNEVLPP